MEEEKRERKLGGGDTCTPCLEISPHGMCSEQKVFRRIASSDTEHSLGQALGASEYPPQTYWDPPDNDYSLNNALTVGRRKS